MTAQVPPVAEASPAGGLREWFATTFSALTVRNYRLFMAGQSLSLTGTWMRRTALGWVVFQMTGSEGLLGLVMGLAVLPMALLSPVAGMLADRMDKRTIIIASQLLSFCSSSLLAFGVLAGTIQIWQIMTLAVVGGMAFAFEVPARQAFVVELVGRQNLLNAIALNSGLVNLARIVGPTLAGVLIGRSEALLHLLAGTGGWAVDPAFALRFGTGVVFTLDALSYLVTTGTLLALRLEKRARAAIRGSAAGHLAEGLRECWRNTRVRTMLILLTVTGVFGWGFQTLLPAIAQDVLRFTPEQYGNLMSAFGLGAIGGAIFVARSRSEKRRRLQAFVGVWIMAGGIMAMTSLWHFAAMVVSLMVAGFGAIMFISTANTRIQLSVADSIRGRVMGIWALGFGGSLPLGSFLIGALAEEIHPFTAIQVFVVIMTCASLALFFSGSRRRLRRMKNAGIDLMTPAPIRELV